MLTAFGGDRFGGDSEQASSAECRFTVTADMLNVRSGPELAAPVVDQLPEGEEVAASGETQGGFRKLDDERWASEEFLDAVSGSNCR